MHQQQFIILLVFITVVFVSIAQCDTLEDEENSHRSRRATNVCDSTACNTPLTGLQNSTRFTSSDYVRNLLDPTFWVNTPGGNVSYFNLSTTPALAGIGIAFSLAMLEPCGIILPHIHPRGSKGIYSITGKSLLVGFIQENKAQLILNTIGIGYATVIPKGAIHFVQNLDCENSTQLDAYNNEDPGLLTLGLNMFRFPDGPLSAGFGETDDYIDNLRQAIPNYPLDVNMDCRKKCGLSTNKWYRTWIPCAGICIGLVIIGIVGGVIVLSLIPTYLSTKNITVKNRLSDPIVITYRSDMINGYRSTITDIQALSTSLGNALHLPEITNLVAQFYPSNGNFTGRKKRDVQGDLMNIQFSLKYPIYCPTDNCHKKVIDEALVHINVLYTTFTLPISFDDGQTFMVRLSLCAAGSLSLEQCYTPQDQVCDAAACNTPLTGLQNSNRFTSSDYVRNLLDPTFWVNTPGGNVSYFNLSTTPALAGIGIAFSLAMLEPCGIILPHIHPRGSKGIYSITGKSLLVGFIQENKAQLILNTIGIGYATVIPKGAIHFVQNLDCENSTQLDAYNNEDPGLLTLGLNMFRFPDGPLSAGFGETDDYIDNLRQAIPNYPLDVNMDCRKKCGLST
ncbi:unnamed protein product [Adineta steineri]|uniref:Cupin type-1 domain-containing protein n=1 Tax=Adineta steineri TaxID=433720 RepID=A0A818PB35_9BILA|nr:unnamed protein product [Adineta steineri]CAF3618466.1 unnamed protein product [Adineta steineri]